jgi:hypothetical protein
MQLSSAFGGGFPNIAKARAMNRWRKVRRAMF